MAAGDDRLDRLIAQVEELMRSNVALAKELRALREENADLRRQLGAARGVHVHQPYANVVQPSGQEALPMPVVERVDGDVFMAVADADVSVGSGAPSRDV